LKPEVSALRFGLGDGQVRMTPGKLTGAWKALVNGMGGNGAMGAEICHNATIRLATRQNRHSSISGNCLTGSGT
jgi:hypothetical protein